ncbi:NAD-dependent protein deacetylase sirtuin-3, mitochondrial [Trichinella patagoniensis]|uniref:NAD-dependent protein deacetylase sirtuin-3, mitochondrial n=1 Tax=Trichinella patagoniensis TaxID=990121 RepID=A0A0V1AEM3_9BILA|nr:NAD-dependent protein deacetylase sirtuin-3, mitochondrial [Trichinella patagoniensis]
MVDSLQAVARLINESLVKRIVVLVGAGISVPSGIPDFRSPESGFYRQIQKEEKISDPASVFDLKLFKRDPTLFYKVAWRLFPGNHKPNEVHYFIRLLQEKDLLLRVYTQNIDDAGINHNMIVEAHGSFRCGKCTQCSKKVSFIEVQDVVRRKEVPLCQRCRGVIKPDVVFFGEMLPLRFMKYVNDIPSADLLIVMGTSLEVYPFAGIIDLVKHTTPRLLINKIAVGQFSENPRQNDYIYEGDVVKGILELCKLLHWTNDLTALMHPSDEVYATITERTETDRFKHFECDVYKEFLSVILFLYRIYNIINIIINNHNHNILEKHHIGTCSENHLT